MNATPEQIQEARKRRMMIRAQIRACNSVRPRCAHCGNDIPVFTADDVVTTERLADPGYDWLISEDFRAGDIVCFWCIVDMTELAGRFVWGRA
jgi:hypothetical protein